MSAKMPKKHVTSEQMIAVIRRILREEETRAKYNGEEFQGMTLEQIAEKVSGRFGDNWLIKG